MNFSNFFLWFLRNCGAAHSGLSNLGSWQCDWASPGDLHRKGSRVLGRLEVPSEWWVSAQESYCWGLSQFLSEPPGCPGWLLLIKNHSEIGTDCTHRGDVSSAAFVFDLVGWGTGSALRRSRDGSDHQLHSHRQDRGHPSAAKHPVTMGTLLAHSLSGVWRS